MRSSRTLIRRWLAIWLVSRLVISAVIIGAASVAGLQDREPTRWLSGWLVSRFAHWDSNLYAAVAHHGYSAGGAESHYNAFFPGLPMVMRTWTSLTGGDEREGALLVILVLGAVAAVGLGQLTLHVTGSRVAATWAVALLAWSPSTVFLSVVLTEAIFLCLIVWAWLFALRRQWVPAGLLAGAACLFRINGLFVVFGLLVLFVISVLERAKAQRPLPRDLLPALVALAVGPVLVAGWCLYLWRLTGHWNAWTVAQETGWGRHMAWPSVGLKDGLFKLFDAPVWDLRLSRALDLVVFIAAPVAATIYAMRRKWAVAAFCGVSAVPIVFSSLLEGGARYLVVWFPLYVSGAVVLTRAPKWVAVLVIGLSASAAMVIAYCWGHELWIA